MFRFISFFPEPEEIDCWSLIETKNDRGQDKPIDIKVKNEKEDKGG